MTSPRLATFARSVREALQVRVKEMPAVPATCFLDDLTTKNVIVQDGVLQGVVDFDHVCYGDPLFWIALTSTAIVSDVGEAYLTYTEELCESWGVDPLSAGALALYTAVHCHRFLANRSEEGPVWLERMLTYGERQVTFAMDDAA
jgi:aminoglycoside phosphotransferase (APT) family kinase protein